MGRPFVSFNQDAPGVLVCTVPHAGRDYPQELAGELAVRLDQVRPLEDRFADLLAADVVAAGHHVLVARTPRLIIDLNRAETDFTASAVRGARSSSPRPSHRARGGLGLVPDRLGPMRLWNAPLDAATLAWRISQVHRPWHRAVAEALAKAHRRHGHAILIDVHSMPPLPGPQAAQIVIGDLFGASATSDLTAAAVAVCRAHGLRAAVNAPYAGAHMLERHGAPGQGISALQIEVDRRLYLDARLDRPGPGLAAVRHLLADIVRELEGCMPATDLPVAAE